MRAAIMMIVALAACADPTLEGTYAGKGGAPGMDYPADWTLKLNAPAMADGVTTVSGTYTITGIGLDTGGAISGSFEDPDLSLTLTATTSQNCSYTVMATWKGDEIDGTYMAIQCFVVAEGNLMLSRK